MTVPHVTMWTGEYEAQKQIFEERKRKDNEVLVSAVQFPSGGMGLTMPESWDFFIDHLGIMWNTPPNTPGIGKPMFAQIHALRQRECVLESICQVCAGPVGQETIWHVSSVEDDERGIVTTDAPTCVDCATVALQQCPHLIKTLVGDRPTSMTLHVKAWEWYGYTGSITMLGGPEKHALLPKESAATWPPRLFLARQATALITEYERI